MTKLLIALFMQDPTLARRLLAWLQREFSKKQKWFQSVLPGNRYEEWVDKQW